MIYLLQQFLYKSADIYADNIAIVDGERSHSYKDLLSSAQLFATALNKAPTVRGGLVGIYLPKSFEAIAVQFAALESGLAYAPLDPGNLPESRLALTLQQAEINTVVTTRVLWERLLSALTELGFKLQQTTHVIYVEDVATTPQGFAPKRPQLCGTEADLAFVLFTSGSTGKPKGVSVSHRNALTFIEWAISYFGPVPGSRFASVASLSFDLSVFDVFVCLATGGQLHLVPVNVASNPRLTVPWITKNAIEIWYSVPSVWIAILRYTSVAFEDLSSLRKILFAGEPFPSRQLSRLMALCPSAQYFNLYGPTETNVCTVFEVTGPAGEAPIPIGTACENYEVFLFDDNLVEPLQGDLGEIMVFGPAVTNGYYMDPQNTELVFVDSPFHHHLGRRLYRTGDLARKDTAGQLHYAGRKDTMVKVQGFRVELGDIENAVAEHPDVEQAVAIPFVDDMSEALSVGLLVVPSLDFKRREGDSVSLVKLVLEFATIKLPRYMVPSIAFVVSDVPRNANGKLERAGSTTCFSEMLRALRANR